VQVVSTGTPQAMVPVRSLEVLKNLRPDFQRLGELERSGEFFGAHIFALETFDAGNRTHARHFAANAGIPEDPVTGSATGGMAAYLWKYGLIRDPSYTVEQGHIMGRPGHVDVEVDADGDQPVQVRIAGTAVTVLTGTITV
jgi:trans-2,3-dihydro-3-hydroxyanthranilate isomerase